MPLDASDRIRKMQELTIFSAYATAQQTLQPGKDVVNIIGFYRSTTTHTYTDYTNKAQIEQGRKYFSTYIGSR